MPPRRSIPIRSTGRAHGRGGGFEFSQTSGGTVYVRYLPTGTAAGTLEPYLTVATYPRPNGYAEVQAAAKNEGSKSFEVAEGGLAVYDPASPTNVHIGFPGKAYQIEVFAPEKGLALRLSHEREDQGRPVGKPLRRAPAVDVPSSKDKDDLRPPFTTGETCHQRVEYEPTLREKSPAKDGFPPP